MEFIFIALVFYAFVTLALVCFGRAAAMGDRIEVYVDAPTDNGTPVARRVRKARGLSEAAQLPKGMLLCASRSSFQSP